MVQLIKVKTILEILLPCSPQRMLAGLLVLVVGSGLCPSTSLAKQVEWNQLYPVPRVASAMAYDASRGVAVLFGGRDSTSGQSYGDTWEWDGVSWTEQAVNGPSARDGHAMAYDSVRGVTVLFGGTNNAVANGETWEWNGAVWTQRAVSGPSARKAHKMAFDSARGVTVLFGGSRDSANAETWNGTVLLGPNAPSTDPLQEGITRWSTTRLGM